MADYRQPDAATKRVRFFDGQFLQDQDFIDEQKYHLDRERRTLRELGVPGVLTGLQVTTSAPYEMTISPGTAVDALGRHIVLTEPLVLTFPKKNVTEAFPVSIRFREVESDIATTGGQSATRWDESPTAGAALQDGTAVVAPSDAPTTWDDPGVGLGSWTITNGSFVAAGTAQVAGLRVPGYVGVGTADPKARLHIVDANTPPATGGSVIVGPANQPNLGLGYQATYAWIQSHNGAPLAINPAGSNVGIGTTAPAAPLHVQEPTGTAHGPNQGSVIIDHDNAGGASSLVFRSKGSRGSDYGFIQYQDAPTVGGTGESARLIVGINNDADDHLILQPSGNVGIGTMSPGAKLDLLGTLSVTAGSSADAGPALFVNASGNVGIGTTTPENAEGWWRTLDLYSSVAAKLSVRIAGIDTRIMAHPTGHFGAPAGQIIGTATNHPLSLATNSATRLTVAANGNTGIGTTTPAVRLHVVDANTSPDSGGSVIVGPTNQPNLRLGYQATYTWIQSNGPSPLAINPIGNNVGIGTMNPAAKLDLLGTLNVTADSSRDAGPALSVNASGDVGVGTTTPENADGWSRTLDLYGSATAKLSVRAPGIDARIMAHNAGTYGAPAGQIIGTATNHPLTLVTNKANRLIVAANGNVGIGSPTTPWTLLDVWGGRVRIMEPTGTTHGPDQGSLIIDHDNSGGASSIVFRSCGNRGSDYGFIQYQDAPTVGGTGESARFIVGINNDADDHLIL
ncbi:hypothetical protein AB0M46_04125 [Dactylosporangium sp. NPDC051485]|uniref:hypothetical protein n=1 Tax=Dactylosporangium sp. NPDC051485 TaxID=3154846 RepID=UPI00343EE19D